MVLALTDARHMRVGRGTSHYAQKNVRSPGGNPVVGTAVDGTINPRRNPRCSQRPQPRRSSGRTSHTHQRRTAYGVLCFNGCCWRVPFCESQTWSPVSVPRELERLPARVKHTVVATVQDGTVSRIEKVEIKGENVAHTFEKVLGLLLRSLRTNPGALGDPPR